MPDRVVRHARPVSNEEGLPHARPVDATAVTERPTPWLPARTVLINLVLIFVGGGLFWFLIDRVQAPMWVAFVAYAVIFTVGSLAVRFIRNARADRSHE
jgi:hypothetical protein